MNYIQAEVLNHLNDSREWVIGVGGRVRERVYNQAGTFRAKVINLRESCQRGVAQINQSCVDTANRVAEFLYQHQETLMFTFCCITTAYFAPSLFFSGFFLSFAGRIELANYCRNLANHYMKDEVNPYRLNPIYTTCVSNINLGIGAIAAIDSVGIGTIFMANTWTLSMIPFLGGVAAGNSAAKFWMNTTHFLDDQLHA